ncbi:DUF4863 domain-containing protein [Actinomadura craniellae]|uniref:DUF4863 domain-containing protein n=1 Tax=Actinomadura craniellae TaxID=2231787 RepID=A0A365GVK5_9ACTN|nr:DUF4863 family protein [Actinomadura craniellae]RAY10778.1 DUF4863 domain-containing protein [Actinomadura craniellae]
MNSRLALIEHSISFLDEVKNRTAGEELESWLNHTYPAGSELYAELARLIKIGVLEEGWAANVEVDGPRYRRSRIADPSEDTFYFSITAVYMDSVDRYRGQYHAHPYGELNLVVPIDPGARLMGPRGWQGTGWTAPGPGSHHYPEVRGGALIALFYLPAGRISYDITPDPAEVSGDPA